MFLTIKHQTRYDYDRPVDYALQKVRLRPLSGPMQSVEAWEVSIDGGRIEAGYVDHYGNHVDLVSADCGTQHVNITAQGRINTHDKAGVLGTFYGRAPLWHWAQETALTQAGPKITALSDIIGAHPTPLDGVHALTAAILNDVVYDIGHTSPSTSAEAAVGLGHGVCQDHANILVACARVAGLPARYVSGYLLMPDRVDQDASHAWAEVHFEDLGWVGFDVSNGISPDEKYVRIAIGRDSQDAAPIVGLRAGASTESMIVNLQVQQ